MRRPRRLWLLAWLLVLAACQVGTAAPTPAPLVIEQHTSTPSLTPSLTPVWFPPTETPTPLPSLTLQPTEDFRPGVLSPILNDDFSHGDWQAYKNEAGQAAFGKNELTLAVSLANGVLSSLRASPVPGDGYLEITATPNLCQRADIFGIYLRAASPNDGYRLLMNCAGMLRLERLKHSELVVLQDWQPGVGIVPGGMLPLRLGIWANARDLRIFVNDQYQFGARDPVWTEGMVGVYARAASDSPLTVSFSNLVVSSLDPARIPTLTPQPTAKP